MLETCLHIILGIRVHNIQHALTINNFYFLI